MASIDNRSAFTVSVARHPKLTKIFPFKRQRDAATYLKSLVDQGHSPDIKQGEDAYQVRVRRIGHKDQIVTFRTLNEAETFVSKVDAEQRTGLFRDYTQAAKTTTVDLIQRYIEEDCPGLKGGANYAIILRAMVQDSTHELRRRIAMRKQEMREFGEVRTPLGANREPMTSLEWLNLPIAEVMPAHIEDFISDRVEYVAAATVDRQLDLLATIYNRARDSWRIHMDLSPMSGVKRPRYFNERERRLSASEEFRLLEAARQEDQVRSFETHVEMLATEEVERARELDTHYAVNEARKMAYEHARRRALEEGFPHVPLLETLIKFQLATAARRGEALGLFWNQIDFDGQAACLPTSKNGRPRKLAVRMDILELLRALPRTCDLVFDIGLKELVNAWKRICEAAGIEDLRIHDLRHEGISRAAESGVFATVLDLQAYSGHRDIRSLTRYTHLCTGAIARNLEKAEEARQATLGNKGYSRLKVKELMVLGRGADEPEDLPPNVVRLRG